LAQQLPTQFAQFGQSVPRQLTAEVPSAKVPGVQSANRQSAISNQQSAISNQQSAISNQQSAIPRVSLSHNIATPMTQPSEQPVTIPLPEGSISGLMVVPENAAFLYVLAHGAGAGMRHPFLQTVAAKLAPLGIATLRYQFPYMEAGRKRTDSAEVAHAAVRAAVNFGAGSLPGVPLLAGGKSFGGRMTSGAQAKAPLPGVRGLVFLGFPLHPPGKPDVVRAEHLDQIAVPMLFLQGTRDDFARLDLITTVTSRLSARATLDLVEGADHSFNMLKNSGRTTAQVLEGLCVTISAWVNSLVSPQGRS
jgi:predicted alpha/beta-hydrolase family hydrolase